MRTSRQAVNDDRRDCLLKQRERQRFYVFRDTRTHEEREEAHVRRRNERMRTSQADLHNKDSEMLECTFQPEFSGRPSPRSRSTPATPRSTSSTCNGTPGGKSGGRFKPWEVPQSPLIQALLEKQLTLMQKLAEIGHDTRTQHNLMQVRSSSLLPGGAPLSPRDDLRVVAENLKPEHQAAELRLYRRMLSIVHALERLEVHVLGLSKEEQKTLAALGFKNQLATTVRRQLHAPGVVDTGASSTESSLTLAPSANSGLLSSADPSPAGAEALGDTLLALPATPQPHASPMLVGDFGPDGCVVSMIGASVSFKEQDEGVTLQSD